IRSDGYREILGVKMGDTESFAIWEETFRWLKGRGLKGVMFVISDDHGGLTEAVARHFQGASWQRCQVHLMRNILGQCARRHRADVAAAAQRVLQAPDMDDARRRLAEFVERFAKTAPKSVECLEAGFEDAMAVMSLPEKYRKRLRTTNMQERLNEEVRRRERVIRIFPNDESALRLIGALLAEQNEVWQERKYLDMDEFNEWAAARKNPPEDSKVIA
ncbi:IS256 family transposase, partial [Ferrigenium sp. UT5]|uniref:IS256 family transposase n=1 Tax=Ferrigenium sp. UT5 TaxID=3242105 RepID=UPI0038B3E759